MLRQHLLVLASEVGGRRGVLNADLVGLEILVRDGVNSALTLNTEARRGGGRGIRLVTATVGVLGVGNNSAALSTASLAGTAAVFDLFPGKLERTTTGQNNTPTMTAGLCLCELSGDFQLRSRFLGDLYIVTDWIRLWVAGKSSLEIKIDASKLAQELRKLLQKAGLAKHGGVDLLAGFSITTRRSARAHLKSFVDQLVGS